MTATAETTPPINPLEVRGQPPIDVDAREVTDEDVRHWSVTEIIRAVGDGEGLLRWAARETAVAAVRQRATWTAMEQDSGSDEAIYWLSGARFRKPRGQISDSAFGTGVHGLLERYALTGVRPAPTLDVFGTDEDIANATQCLDQFDRWLNDFQPTYLATEAAVFSPSYGYAGTADCFVEIGGVRFVGDYKSSRKSTTAKGAPTKPYADSVGLQLGAYAGAELMATWRARRFEHVAKRYYLLNEAERAMASPVPAVDFGLAIHITPEHCDAYPIPSPESGLTIADVHRAFLNAQEVARWVYQESRKAMGDKLARPGATT